MDITEAKSLHILVEEVVSFNLRGVTSKLFKNFRNEQNIMQSQILMNNVPKCQKMSLLKFCQISKSERPQLWRSLKKR